MFKVLQIAPVAAGTEAADTPIASWMALGGDLDQHLERFLNTWAPAQIAVIAVAYWLAAILARKLTPHLEEQVRKIERQPRLLRALILPIRWLKWIIFVLLLWLVVASMADVTRLSRTYLVGLAANLVTAWVVISIASRLIRSRSLSQIFIYTAWGVAALHILGILPQALALLDQASFSLGALRLSLLVVLKAVVLLALLLWLANLGGEVIEQRLLSGSDITPTAQVLLSKLVKATLVVGAFLVALTATGIDLTALALFSGAVGIGVGFGLQKVASNLISGIIILLDRSIKPGDVISLGDTFGWISSLRARYVSVVTRDGAEYLIPNEAFVTDRVINWSYTDKLIRLEIKFGVSYDSNPHEVRRVAVESLKKVTRATSHHAPVCHVIGFGDSSIDFVLRFWIVDPQDGLTNVRGEAFLALWDALHAANISIPYPHREVIIRQQTQGTDLAAPVRTQGTAG